MVGENELINWNSTFKMFDRDGGGDISLQEIGLLFRQLGYAPAEAEMRALVDEVDADDSGTVDFEEFCLLMLRLKRGPLIPDWLNDLFAPPEHQEEVVEEVVLSQPHARQGFETSVVGDEGKGGPYPPLSREELIYLADLLPLCTTVHSLALSGYGEACGPFLAEELAMGVGRSNKDLTTLELAHNAMGDRGALAWAEAFGKNGTLTHLDLSFNGISAEGGQALLDALTPPPLPAPPPPGEPKPKRRSGAGLSGSKSSGKSADELRSSSRSDASLGSVGGAGGGAGGGSSAEFIALQTAKYKEVRSALRVLRLEGNELPPSLMAEIEARLLLLDLPRIFAAQARNLARSLPCLPLSPCSQLPLRR